MGTGCSRLEASPASDWPKTNLVQSFSRFGSISSTAATVFIYIYVLTYRILCSDIRKNYINAEKYAGNISQTRGRNGSKAKAVNKVGGALPPLTALSHSWVARTCSCCPITSRAFAYATDNARITQNVCAKTQSGHSTVVSTLFPLSRNDYATQCNATPHWTEM